MQEIVIAVVIILRASLIESSALMLLLRIFIFLSRDEIISRQLF